MGPLAGEVLGGGGTCRPRRGVAPTRRPSCRRRRPRRPCGTARPRQRRRRRRPGGPERVREPGAAAQAPPLTAAAASPRSRGGAKVLKRISLLGVKVSDFGSLRAPRLPARRRPGGPRRGPRPPALPVSTAAGWRLAGPGTAGDPGGKLPSLRGGGRRVGAWPASLASCRAVPNRAGPVPGRTVGMAGRGCDPPVPAGAESGAPRGRGGSRQRVGAWRRHDRGRGHRGRQRCRPLGGRHGGGPGRPEVSEGAGTPPAATGRGASGGRVGAAGGCAGAGAAEERDSSFPPGAACADGRGRGGPFLAPPRPPPPPWPG